MNTLKVGGIFLLAIAGLISVTSCDSKITNPTNTEPARVELVPLSLGNKWVFRRRMYGYEDPYTDSVDSSWIDSAFVYQGRLWYGVRGGSGFTSNDSLGYWGLSIVEEDTAWTTELLYPYPAAIGTTWTSESDSMTFTVAATGLTVTVPAGTFKGCIRYNVQQSEGITNYIIARPGIGFIKSFYDNPVMYPPISVTFELMSFRVVE